MEQGGTAIGSSVPLPHDQPTGDERAGAADRGSRATVELLLLACLFLPEIALFLALIAGGLEISQYLLLHVGVCASAAAIGICVTWWASAGADARSRTAVLLHATVWIILAGPFGAFIAAVLLMPRAVSLGQGEGMLGQAASEPSEQTRLEKLHSRLLDRRLRLEHAHHIRPLLDVMIDGTQTEKLDALRLIAKRYVPGLAPAIRRALEDKDAAVRVFAATVIAQQNNMHTKRIGALQTIAANAPECMENWRELAQAHADYAASGLLETSRAEAETRQAQTYMARAAQNAVSVEPA